MGVFGRRVPIWQPFGPLAWSDVRILMLGLPRDEDHTEYLLSQLYRHRQSEVTWRRAVAGTHVLFQELLPVLEQRAEAVVDDTVVVQALATGYMLAHEDVQWGTGQREGLIHTATHNALCLLRDEYPAAQLMTANRALEAGYYFGRRDCGQAVNEVISALIER